MKIAESLTDLVIDIPSTVGANGHGVRMDASTSSNTGQNSSSLLYDNIIPIDQIWNRQIVVGDQRRSVTNYTWRRILSASRLLYSNFGPVRGPVIEKGVYSVCGGWIPHFIGTDEAWGDKAQEWLWNWHKICDVRGDPYDFESNLFIASVALDRDGDWMTIFAPNSDGYPMIQFLPSHRLGSRNPQTILGGWDTSLPGMPIGAGPFQGNYEYQGVVFNPAGRTIGYHILGDIPEEDYWITTYDGFLMYETEWTDQGRGLSAFAHAILDCEAVQDIRVNELISNIAQSTVSLLETNELGRLDLGNKYMAAAVGKDKTQNNIAIETLDRGTIKYFKAGSGAKLEMLKADRPGDHYIPYMEHLFTGIYQGIMWDRMFSQDPSKLGGVNGRMVMDKIRRSISKRQQTLKKSALRIDRYAIAKAIKIGLLPPNDEWWKWDYQMPRKPTSDEGNDRKARIEDYKIGFSTYREVCAEEGRWWKDVRNQQQAEVKDLLDKAKQVVKDSDGELSLQEALTLLQQRAPNPTTDRERPQDTQIPEPGVAA